MEKRFISTTELAEILGVSRVTVFTRIKKGEIKANKIGRNFVIDKKDLGDILSGELTQKQKAKIDKGMNKLIKEYGETLKMLGKT